MLRQKANTLSILGSICLLLVRLASSACTDGNGMPITSIFRFPTFEDTAMAVQTTHDDAISNATASLSEILSLDPADLTFDNTLGALDALLFEFYSPYHRLDILSVASNKKEVREAALQAVINMTKWSNDNIDFNVDLYQVLVAFGETDEATGLSGERLRLFTETIANYERRGMALGAEDRAQLSEWQDRLNELTTGIDTNINNDQGIVNFTREELAGLTDRQLAALDYDANTTLYTALTAIRTQYNVIATYANQSSTRLKNLRAKIQRAKEENGEVILEAVQMRQKIASLLGFDHWADYRTASAMAGNGTIAYGFIENLDQRLGERFLKEKKLLGDLKKEHLGDPAVDLKREDVRFYTNVLKERYHQIDQEEISEYFEEKATLRGMFDVYEDLFNISITLSPNGAPGGAWADDVQFVYIYEKGDEMSPLGGVYLDLHPRTGKFNYYFAVFSLIQGRRFMDESASGGISYQAPLCVLGGNWPVPVGNASVSLWKFSDVDVIFHEFGHVLHEVLTCAEFSSMTGFAVPQDFVEVPSKMLERWLEDITVVGRFARHYETGVPMPDDLLQRLVDAKYATVGHHTKGRVSLGMSDFRIHMYRSLEEIPQTPKDLYSATNIDYSSFYPVPNDTALLASFGHLFGGYDAGYYGYAWSDAIAADLASRFRNSTDGFMDSQLGALFRKEILEPGNSRDPNDLIRAFLGRDWNTEAFFEEMGVAEDIDDIETQEWEPDESSDGEKAGSKAGMFVCYGVAVIAWLVW